MRAHGWCQLDGIASGRFNSTSQVVLASILRWHAEAPARRQCHEKARNTSVESIAGKSRKLELRYEFP